MDNFDNLCNTQNIQQEYENNNSNIWFVAWFTTLNLFS
jgi:hypothetical protein